MGAKHYQHQVDMTHQHVLPLLKNELMLSKTDKILEVGCAEAGLVAALVDQGYKCDGVELVQARLDLALQKNPNLNIIQGDITNPDISQYLNGPYELIIIRDVIEHIPNKKGAMEVMNSLLRPGGALYITFPPYYSPYAGHQQNSKKLFKYLFWIHLFPNSIIKWLGKATNENPNLVKEVILNSKIGLTINRFESIVRETNFEAIRKDLFASRPVYKVRWNWPVIRFLNIPILREVFATGCEYILQKKQ